MREERRDRRGEGYGNRKLLFCEPHSKVIKSRNGGLYFVLPKLIPKLFVLRKRDGKRDRMKWSGKSEKGERQKREREEREKEDRVMEEMRKEKRNRR